MAVVSKLYINNKNITKYNNKTIKEIINNENSITGLPVGTYHFAENTEVLNTDNLFNENIDIINNYYISNSGTLTYNTNWKCTDYIPVNGKSFTLKNISGSAPGMAAYDINKNYITGISYNGRNIVEITSNSKICYIRFSISNNLNINNIELTCNSSSLICLNSVEEPIIDMKILGETEQNGEPTIQVPAEIKSVGDRVENLIKLPYDAQSTAFYQVNADGSIHVNISNAPGFSTFYLKRSGTIKAGTYIWTCGNSDIQFIFNYVNNGVAAWKTLIDGETITFEADFNYNIMYLQISPNTTINQTIYPTFVEGTDVNKIGKYIIPISTSTLPIAYQEVEYLESTGTQWIDTGIIFKENTEITTEYELVANEQSYVWGNSNGGSRMQFSHQAGLQKVFCGWGGNPQSGYEEVDFTASIGRKYKVDCNKGEFKINNEFIVKIVSTTLENDTNGLTLFGAKVSSLTTNRFSKIKIYSHKVSQNNELVQDLIPCIRIQDNVAGMYDKVTGTFYTNDGTGSFVTGKKLVEITKNIYLDEPLKKLNNSDYLDYKNKKVVKYSIQKVFTGDENWGIYFGQYYISLPIYYAGSPNAICSHFKFNSSAYAAGTELGSFYFNGGGVNYNWNGNVTFNYDDSGTDLAGFKTFLRTQYEQGTPVTLVYSLINPIEETIEIPEILTYEGNNRIDINTDIQSKEVKINYWKQIE